MCACLTLCVKPLLYYLLLHLIPIMKLTNLLVPSSTRGASSRPSRRLRSTNRLVQAVTWSNTCPPAKVRAFASRLDTSAFVSAVPQIFAISWGLVEPRTLSELYVFLISLVLGASFYGAFVAVLTAVLSEGDAAGQEYRRKLDKIQQYMNHHNMRAPAHQH